MEYWTDHLQHSDGRVFIYNNLKNLLKNILNKPGRKSVPALHPGLSVYR